LIPGYSKYPYLSFERWRAIPKNFTIGTQLTVFCPLDGEGRKIKPLEWRFENADTD